MIFLKILVGFLMIEIMGRITRKITTGKWLDTEGFKRSWDILVETWKTRPVVLIAAMIFMIGLCWIIGHATLLPFL